MATVQIKIADEDFTARIVFASASFESAVNGATGPCKFRVRDDDRTITLVTGSIIELLIDGDPVWTGYLTHVNRVYAFPAENTAEAGLTRWFDVEGTDLNILFTKRIVFRAADPENVYGKLYGPGTADNVAIADLVTDFLDLSGDDLDVSTMVENVADINVDQKARPWSSGFTWGQAMASIAMLPAAVYFIDPQRRLVYTDVNTPNSDLGLSDQPGSGQAGYREMTILKDGAELANDVLAWGMGYASATPVFVRDQDATSQAQHGLWQMGVVKSGIYKQATINRVAQSIIDGSPFSKRGAKNDKVAVNLVVYEPGFLPAQKVEFESHIFDFFDTIPIRKMKVTFETPDTPRYELLLSHAIDDPWSFTDPFQFDFNLPPPPPPPVFPPPPPLPPIFGPIDTFEGRTVAGGWRTASSGYDWEGSTGGPNIQSSVNNGIGFMNLGTSAIHSWATNLRYIEDPAVDDVFGGDYDLYFEIAFDRGPTIVAGDYIQNVVGYTEEGNFFSRTSSGVIGKQHAVVIFWSVSAALTRIGVTTNPVPSSATMAWSAPITLVQDVAYGVRWQRVGTTTRARIWDLMTAEPATWDVSATVTVDFTNPLLFFGTMFARLGAPAIANVLSTYTIISDPPIAQVFPGSIFVGPGAFGCEMPMRASSFVFAASREFAPGSTIVSRGGLLARRDVDYTEIDDFTRIEFTTEVDESEAILLCYQTALT